MTVYNWNDNAGLPPAVIYDGDGNQIQAVVQCDTETGEVIRIDESVVKKENLKPPLAVYFKGPPKGDA